MFWTKEKPTKEGWYWYRKYPSWGGKPTEVTRDEKLGLLMEGWTLKYHEGEWAEIPYPETK